MEPSTAVSAGDPANTTLSPTQLAETTNIGDLRDKIALVTGASSGIGRAIAQVYAAAGAYVVNADLGPNPPPAPHLAAQDGFQNVDLVTPTVDLINKQFPSQRTDGFARALFVECDVTSAASVENAVQATATVYGRLDILVNNAGISTNSQRLGSDRRIHETDPTVLDADFAVNVKGVWLGCKYAITQMLLHQPPGRGGDRGWIINVSSVGGLVGLRELSTYCATKGAVVQMTKSLALDHARDRIHVNCINPGFVETSMMEPLRAIDDDGRARAALTALHPWGRLALAEDIAKMAVFLAGDGASFVTGAIFAVDGGYTAQ